MRSPKVLEKMVVDTIALTKGECVFDILAIDAEEVEWFKARLKGRHNAKFVGIHLGEPGDELPMMGRVPMDPDSGTPPAGATTTKPKRAKPQLTEDGY